MANENKNPQPQQEPVKETAKSIDFAKLDINTFIDLQGITDNVTLIVMRKHYAGQIKSYDDWHTETSKEFIVSEKKKDYCIKK